MKGSGSEVDLQNEQEIIDIVLENVRSAGAEAQIVFVRKDSWEGGVSNEAVENLASSFSVRLSVNVYFPDGRCSNVETNDLRESSILALTKNAIAIAEASEANPHRGLPPSESCGKAKVENIDDGGARFSSDRVLEELLNAESQMRSMDSRVVGVQSFSADRNRIRRRIINSRGVDLTTSSTLYSICIAVVAEQDGEKQMGYKFSSTRNFQDRIAARELAEAAVEKALRKFGWKKPVSGPVGVVLANNVASDLLSLVRILAGGDSFISKRSYWMDCLNAVVASECVTIVDDPLVPGGVGSRECDGTGVRAEPLTIVEKGMFRSVMTDAYSARTLSMPLTGHADGPSNLVLCPGSKSQEDLLEELGTGFFVTETQGKSIDTTAGTWSKGASGFWVENGKISHPVQGVTLAGNLEDILKGVVAVGSDLRKDCEVSSPSLLIPQGLTLGGE